MADVTTAVRLGERLIDAADRPGVDVTNPADLGDTVGTVPALTPDDVAQAFAAAATAQCGWHNLGWIGRGEVLFRAAAEIRSRAEELTALIVRENGKLWAEAAGEVGKGVFVAPTILAGVGKHGTVWRQEIFGPVLAVHRLELEGPEFLHEAIRITNDSPYGLSASVYTNDLGEDMAFASAVDTGQVAVNLPTSGWDVHHPFGGFADSGSAFKEQGREALAFYSRVKTVAVSAPYPALRRTRRATCA